MKYTQKQDEKEEISIPWLRGKQEREKYEHKPSFLEKAALFPEACIEKIIDVAGKYPRTAIVVGSVAIFAGMCIPPMIAGHYADKRAEKSKIESAAKEEPQNQNPYKTQIEELRGGN
jgi:hypothetical protein